jgi:hypothetical protein
VWPLGHDQSSQSAILGQTVSLDESPSGARQDKNGLVQTSGQTRHRPPEGICLCGGPRRDLGTGRCDPPISAARPGVLNRGKGDVALARDVLDRLLVDVAGVQAASSWGYRPKTASCSRAKEVAGLREGLKRPQQAQLAVLADSSTVAEVLLELDPAKLDAMLSEPDPLLMYVLILANRRSVLGTAANGRTSRVVATVCVSAVGLLSFIVLIESVTGLG